MSPKLSVVIPIYRVEKYLRQCLDSIVNQTFRDMEIILVDDGSPDHCGEICDEYAKKDGRIVVIHKQNEGLSAARNEGITRSAGEWVTFIDSDDWCDLDFYEQMFEALGTQQADIFCSGGCYWEYVGETEKSQTFVEPFLFSDKEHIESLRAKVICAACSDIGNKSTISAVWNKLYRREFLKQNNLVFDVSSKAWEDIWFNFRALGEAKAVGGCACVGYRYRQVAASITKGFTPQRPKTDYDFVEKLYSCIDEHQPSTLLLQAIEVQSMALFKNTLKQYCFHPANQKPYSETAQELRAMKTWPYYQKMIYCKGNPYFTKKQLFYQWLLRMPWIWPLSLAYRANLLLTGSNSKKNYS